MAANYDEIALGAYGAEVPEAMLAGPAFQHLGTETAGPFRYTRMADRTVALPGNDAVLAIRAAAALGTRVLVVGAVARAVNRRLLPGQIMVWSDHINATGANPLTARDDPRFGPYFLDLSAPYDAALGAAAVAATTAKGLTAHRGVYLDAPGCLPGTDDDLRAMRMLGADAAGVGGVTEVIVGVQAGLKVLGLALVAEDIVSAATCLLPLLAVAESCIGSVETRP